MFLGGIYLYFLLQLSCVPSSLSVNGDNGEHLKRLLFLVSRSLCVPVPGINSRIKNVNGADGDRMLLKSPAE